MSRNPSAADRALIDELSARGVTVTSRQLERWRGAGIIWTERSWTGKGRGGSKSAYPEETADQVVALLEALDESRSLDAAALTLFGMGRRIQHAQLVGAYLRSYEAFESYGPDEGDSWDRADMVTRSRSFASHPVVRAWRKRIRHRPGRQDPVHFEARSTGSSVLHVLQTGEPPSEEAAGLILEASGYQPVAESEEMREDFADAIAVLSFPALAQTVSSASMDELEKARDSLVGLSGFLSDVTDAFIENDPLLVAIVSPALIQVMRLVGPMWEELLSAEMK
jgi:hypothetical protein